MKRLFLCGLAILLSTMLFSCSTSNVEDKEFVRVGKAIVYDSDVNLYLKEKKLSRFSKKADTQIPNLLRDVAFAEEALKKYKGIALLANSHTEFMETRVLTSVYQRFFALENLFYDDATLSRVYMADSMQYKSDSTQTYFDVRGLVAENLYIKDHEKEYNEVLTSVLNNLKAKGSTPNEEMAKITAKSKFLEQVRTHIMQTEGSRLVKKYNLKVAPPVKQDPKQVFEKDSTIWKRSPGLYAYHIQMSDSLKLAEIAKRIHSLEDFKKEALNSENKETAKNGGALGVILKDHAIPYGIGLQPNVFEAYGDSLTGLSRVMRQVKPVAFQLYFVTEHVPPMQKSFARAKGVIKAAIAAGSVAQDSLAPLVLLDDKPVLFERDLQKLRLELPLAERNSYTRAQLASYMMEWYAFALEAKAKGLENTIEYASEMRTMQRLYIKRLAEDSLKSVKLLSKEEAKPYFEKYGRAFLGQDSSLILEELSLLATIPENEIRYEYFYNKDVLDTSLDYIGALKNTYSAIEKRAKEFKVRRFVALAEQENKLQFASENHPYVSWNISAEASILRADSLNSAHKRDLARWEWSVLRALHTENDSIFAKATFELGKLEVDAGNFEEALKEYSAVAFMFEGSPYAEKALFGLAFVLDENLKKTDAALILYKRFLERYPNSEMTESVKWLLQNIESNDSLVNELVKHIEKSDSK